MKTIMIVFFYAAISFGQSSFQINHINRISHCHLKLDDSYAEYLNEHQLTIDKASIDQNALLLIDHLGLLFPEIEFSINPTPDANELARSSISGEERKVIIYTSLINTKLIGVEAKAMILAHQIAHHYAGPHENHLHWSSNEANADFNAISRILPKLWSETELGSVLVKGRNQLKRVFLAAQYPSVWEPEHINYSKKVFEPAFASIIDESVRPNEKYMFLPPGLDKSHGHFKELMLDTTRDMHELNEMISEFERAYPEVKIKIMWNVEAINARAYEKDKQKYVELYGGMINHPYVGIDALKIVTAHEIGHHYGGEPSYEGGLSCEGQADFWAVTECLPEVFTEQEVREIISKGCDQLYLLFTNGLKKNLFKTNTERFDKKYSEKREDCDHPSADCRLRTYREGLKKNPAKPSCAG